MWKNENGPYMQAMYFTFGLGALLAPLISFKFLDENNNFGESVANTTSGYTIKSYFRGHTMKNKTLARPQFGAHHHNDINPTKLLTPLTKRFNASLNISSNDNTTSGINSSDIYIPYCITGGLLVVSALIIIIMYFVRKYEPILDISGMAKRKDFLINEKIWQKIIITLLFCLINGRYLNLIFFNSNLFLNILIMQNEVTMVKYITFPAN